MSAQAITSRLIEGLYSEALLLADETRGYFDLSGGADRSGFTPAQKVFFACEALKASTRLMQVIAWLLLRKAIAAGELPPSAAADPARRLEDGPPIDIAALVSFPPQARQLIMAGIDLHQRVTRLDAEPIGAGHAHAPVPSPARALLDRLERSI